MGGQKPVEYGYKNCWYFEHIERISHNFGRIWNIRDTGTALNTTAVNLPLFIFKQRDIKRKRGRY